jgi:hypothetical protein
MQLEQELKWGALAQSYYPILGFTGRPALGLVRIRLSGQLDFVLKPAMNGTICFFQSLQCDVFPGLCVAETACISSGQNRPLGCVHVTVDYSLRRCLTQFISAQGGQFLELFQRVSAG